MSVPSSMLELCGRSHTLSRRLSAKAKLRKLYSQVIALSERWSQSRRAVLSTSYLSKDELDQILRDIAEEGS